MGIIQLESVPAAEPVTLGTTEEQKAGDDSARKATKAWIQWLFGASTRINETARLWPSVVLVDRTASIGPTAAVVTDSSGLYRVSYIARCAVPAATSSSFQITIGWTRKGIPQQFTGNVKNGNTTLTYETVTFPVRADRATSITYSVVYASVPANAMQFEIDVVVEAVSA